MSHNFQNKTMKYKHTNNGLVLFADASEGRIYWPTSVHTYIDCKQFQLPPTTEAPCHVVVVDLCTAVRAFALAYMLYLLIHVVFHMSREFDSLSHDIGAKRRRAMEFLWSISAKLMPDMKMAELADLGDVVFKGFPRVRENLCSYDTPCQLGHSSSSVVH